MIIEVKVIPKSSQSRVVGWEGEILKIKCRGVPEKGKVNKEVIVLLAEFFEVPKDAVEILRGKTSPKKVVKIKGK